MAAPKICTTCGYVGKSKRITKGSTFLELLLWIVSVILAVVYSGWFLLAGLLYSLWRIASRYHACPKCGGPNMIPTDSPVGQRLVNEQSQRQPPPPATK